MSDAEKQAIRRASVAQNAGIDLPEKEYADIPRLTEEQLAKLVRPRKVQRKIAVSVRLDPQVLDWLRAQGEGHLTRINGILLERMISEGGGSPRTRFLSQRAAQNGSRTSGPK